jgi:hypothetical protein
MRPFKMEKPQQLALPGFECHFLQKESNEMSVAQMVVPFHGSELFIVEHNGEPYTPMKPIVEGMGLDWKAQFDKIKQRFSTSMVEITIQVSGDIQRRAHLCLPLRKLAGWLYTIHVNKVRPELRERIAQYQDECDDVLWRYWMEGQATNPRRTTKSQRAKLHEAISLLMAKTPGLNYPMVYEMLHQSFNVEHIDEIPEDRLHEAVCVVHSWMMSARTAPMDSGLRTNTHSLVSHMLWLRSFWQSIEQPLRVLNNNLAASAHDHFIDGAIVAGLVGRSLGCELPSREYVMGFPWCESREAQYAYRMRRNQMTLPSRTLTP